MTERTRKLITKAIARYGSEAKLGAAIGYSQNAVHLAKQRGSITWEMATAIHVATDGEINRMMLCPDNKTLERPRR